MKVFKLLKTIAGIRNNLKRVNRMVDKNGKRQEDRKCITKIFVDVHEQFHDIRRAEYSDEGWNAAT